MATIPWPGTVARALQMESHLILNTHKERYLSPFTNKKTNAQRCCALAQVYTQSPAKCEWSELGMDSAFLEN